jgi:hypothetical protein
LDEKAEFEFKVVDSTQRMEENIRGRYIVIFFYVQVCVFISASGGRVGDWERAGGHCTVLVCLRFKSMGGAS